MHPATFFLIGQSSGNLLVIILYDKQMTFANLCSTFLIRGPITLARNSDCINTSRKSSINKQTWEEFRSNGALHEKINKFIHCSWNLSDNNLALVTFAHFGNWPWIIAELNPPADNRKLLSYNTINCKLSSKCTYCLWIRARKRYFRKDHKAKIKIIDKFGCHNDIQNVKYFA